MPQLYVTDGFNRFFHKCQKEGWNNPERPMLVHKAYLEEFLPELEKAINGEPLGNRGPDGSTYHWLKGCDATTCLDSNNGEKTSSSPATKAPFGGSSSSTKKPPGNKPPKGMTRLLRFSVQQAVVDINLNDEGHQEIEIHGAKSPEAEKAIRDYLVNEGIFESILFGKLDFAAQSAENLLLHPELAPQSLL